MATFYGAQASEILRGTQSSDTFKSGGGDDVLYGYAGDDTFVGGTGNDTMFGGKDNDTYLVEDAGDRAIEYAGEGVDTVVSTISYALGANVENLTLKRGYGALNATGNALNNVITGNDSANVIDGGGSEGFFSAITGVPNAPIGFDSLFGGGGDDVLWGFGVQHMFGGADDDTYHVDDAGDRVVELAGEGTDTVIVRGQSAYVMPEHVEAAQLLHTGAITGNGLDNHIVGSNLGAETIDGGLGADTMEGGDSNDVYIVDNVLDRVIEGPSGTFGSEADQIRTTVSYALSAHVESLVLLSAGGAIDGKGNALDNTLYGNEFANTLTGGDGDDTFIGDVVDRYFQSVSDVLIGETGDDRYVVGHRGDVVVERAGEGTDTVYAKVSGYVLADHVENLELGWRTSDGSGNGLDNRLTGNGLGNVLDGRGGADVMVGSTGDDTYVVDNVLDQAVELEGEGLDTVLSSVSFGLGANLENLTLGGAAWKGIGNGLDNRIEGSEAANFLNGQGGDDTLIGGKGDDVLIGGADADSFRFAFGDGKDTVFDFEADAGDVLVLAGYGIDSFATLQKYMSVSGGDTILRFDGMNAITLVGVGAGELRDSDVLFA